VTEANLGRGRRIQTPTAFAGDDGSADPGLRAALAAHAERAGTKDAVLAALAGARLLVPIVAVLDEVDESGGDKSSHMASVSLVQRDGRRGLLAFTGMDSLAAWDASARPVPASAVDVAAAAVVEGAQGVLIDIAGPARFALDGVDLADLAARAQTSDT
jgi:hypothetical protein